MSEEIKKEEIKEEVNDIAEEKPTFEEEFLTGFTTYLVLIIPFLPLRVASKLRNLPETYLENEIFNKFKDLPFENWDASTYANLAHISLTTKNAILKEQIDTLLKEFRKYVLGIVEKIIDYIISEEEGEDERGN
jgi:hypothetical protein